MGSALTAPMVLIADHGPFFNRSTREPADIDVSSSWMCGIDPQTVRQQSILRFTTPIRIRFMVVPSSQSSPAGEQHRPCRACGRNSLLKQVCRLAALGAAVQSSLAWSISAQSILRQDATSPIEGGAIAAGCDLRPCNKSLPRSPPRRNIATASRQFRKTKAVFFSRRSNCLPWCQSLQPGRLTVACQAICVHWWAMC